MYHLHCEVCGRFLLATQDAKHAEGVHYCPQHQPVETAVYLETVFLPGIGTEIADALKAAGYDTAAKVQAASDEDLLAISGIGKTRLRQIREVVSHEMRD